MQLTYGAIWGDIQARVTALRPNDESLIEMSVAFQIFGGVVASLIRQRHQQALAKSRGRVGYDDAGMFVDLELKVENNKIELPADLPNLDGAELEVFSMCGNIPKTIGGATSIADVQNACKVAFAEPVWHRTGRIVEFFGKQAFEFVHVHAVITEPVKAKTQEEAFATPFAMPSDMYDEAVLLTVARIVNAKSLVDDKLNDENDNSKNT